MHRWDPLTQQQLVLLKRLADGDDLSGSEGVDQRGRVYALQNRGLAQVSKKGGAWRASVTEAGTFYLAHGHHPDHPDHQAGGTPAVTGTKRRTARTSEGPGSRPRNETDGPTALAAPTKKRPVDAAQELIKRLQNGEAIRIEDPDEPTRAEWRRTIHAAKQHGLVPVGFHLRHTGRTIGDIVIQLSDDAQPDDTDWNRVRLNIRRDVTQPGRIRTVLEKDPEGLSVSEAAFPRALDLLEGLAAEAKRQGHRLGVLTKNKHPKIYIKVRDVQRTLTLSEERDRVPHVRTPEERRLAKRRPWGHGVPEYDSVDTGRLRLDLIRGWDTKDSWVDGKKSPLEKQLRKIVKDIEAGVDADEKEQLARERAHQEWVAEHERKEAETRAHWEALMAEARVKATDLLRKDTFRAALDAWTKAGEIRALCLELENAGASTDQATTNLERWVVWARSMADLIDPVRSPASLADIAFDVPPGPDDLRPFLDGWSPHNPQKEYRSESDKAAQRDPVFYQDAWHPGLRNKPTWWRR